MIVKVEASKVAQAYDSIHGAQLSCILEGLRTAVWHHGNRDKL